MSNFSFTKLFSSITESTIWAEPDHVRIAWITMMAMADMKGRVYATIPGLAGRARVSVAQCEEALEKFKAPDRYSRSREHEGRRIEDIDGGWVLLNHEKYRAMRDHEKDKERKRNWAAKKRSIDRSRPWASTVDLGGPGVAHRGPQVDPGGPKTEDRVQRTEDRGHTPEDKKENIPSPRGSGGPAHTRIFSEEAEKAGVLVAMLKPDAVGLASVLKTLGDEDHYRNICALYFKSTDKFVEENGFAGRFLLGKLQAILNYEKTCRPSAPKGSAEKSEFDKQWDAERMELLKRLKEAPNA